MLSSLAFSTTIRVASRAKAAPVVFARFATTRFISSGKGPFYAVDAPDGDHDLQDLEESSAWAKRTIDVASVIEDADAITEMHDAVLLGNKSVAFAVDAPDGEHDLEDVEEHMEGVKNIINQASVLEDANEVKEKHQRRRDEELREEIMRKKKSHNNPEIIEFYNSKY